MSMCPHKGLEVELSKNLILYEDFRTPLPFSVVQNNFWNMYDISFSLADAAAVCICTIALIVFKDFFTSKNKDKHSIFFLHKTNCLLQVNIYSNVNKVPALQK